MSDMRLVVTGAAGRMGRMLVKAIHETPGVTLDRRARAAGRAALGAGRRRARRLCRPLGVAITDDPLPLLLDADGIVDFSTPAATVELAALAAQARIAHVIGTTGLQRGGSRQARSRRASRADRALRQHEPRRQSARGAGAAAAKALGAEFDIEIVEMHHRMKVDAPSGTALLLGEAAAQGAAIELASHSARGRDGITGARRRGDIGFASLRGGGVIGDHSVIFAGDGERITLSHQAEDRAFSRAARSRRRYGRAAASRGSIRWATCWDCS